MRASFLRNICGISSRIADLNFYYNANSLMISRQSSCFIIFLTINSQKNKHFAIFICISKLEKFLYEYWKIVKFSDFLLMLQKQF